MTLDAVSPFGVDAAWTNRVARSGLPVIIGGERGTGKTLFARSLHGLSGRSGPFVESPAVAIPDSLEIATMLGHARGAFTGASEARAGHFEAAHGGTLFLDEVGLASGVLQRVLLSLLDDGIVVRLGEVRPRRADVRIVAATNEDLDELVAAGRFRADLLDRFGFMRVTLPPLRNRRAAIGPLAKRFVTDTCRTFAIAPMSIDGEAERVLCAASWPGNIRQLKSACQYAVTMAAPGGMITVDHLPPRGPWAGAGGDRSREVIEDMIRRTKGNKAQAARMLGMSRQHLHRLLGPDRTGFLSHGTGVGVSE